ncbi:hypothetical protein [Natrarchaeobius chitinivorans]|uniref:Uncharacterized protein n=1 Tax=Natrarchaeobius chitinivorans TaxID=1679083 RepID=A0A3N6MCU7_NATCH|nr:hypothetical protein [Natrarchaeobius chitinivorans]RQG94390.1 hypothetical protein EA473_11845 [Natrarchaeobius chitinivorans]
MRLSVPGVPGVYYDTDTGTTAIGVVTTAAGRYAPKPKGYAIQLLPYLWSFEVDLRDVPNDHPIQYLHPEGARSLGGAASGRGGKQAGDELESVLRFVWSVNRELESATNQLIGRPERHDGVVIEIDDGRVGVDGEQLETAEFDVDAGSERATQIEIDDADEDAGSTGGNRNTDPSDAGKDVDNGLEDPGEDVDDAFEDGEADDNGGDDGLEDAGFDDHDSDEFDTGGEL